ncbi:protein of unknown function [Shewanella benthica]|uniref:Uncharacterized protein n=1 Tax=Shewanella benthica TaxID=43661 RepID=A0A330M771_9GAMM|nr:protein of unknown function [Shewanella benthica]
MCGNFFRSQLSVFGLIDIAFDSTLLVFHWLTIKKYPGKYQWHQLYVLVRSKPSL